MSVFRIVFTILSALCLGALIPLGIFAWQYAVICGLGAFLFFVLMLLCKQAQEQRELQKQNEQDQQNQQNNNKDNNP